MRHARSALVALSLLLALHGAAVAGPGNGKNPDRREALLRQLDEARKAALAAIFDKATYRDEDHGRSGQALVDTQVDRVRTIFAAVSPLLQTDVARIAKLPEPKRRAFLETPEAELVPWELAVRRRIADQGTLRKNETLAKVREGALPTDAEREQARLTNDYRLLMGRPALALDARLVACARGHSAEMTRLRYFEHDSPVAENRTPSDRARKAGVKDVAIGENICYGYDSAKAAFDGWYRSAGHHRNVLGDEWASLGVGRDASHWTQSFAGKE